MSVVAGLGRLASLLLVVVPLLLLPAFPARAATTTIVITSTALTPATASVVAGDAVGWRNDSDQAAQVSSNTDNWTFVRLVPPRSTSDARDFPDPGSYGFTVSFRAIPSGPAYADLTGSVAVAAPTATTPSSGTPSLPPPSRPPPAPGAPVPAPTSAAPSASAAPSPVVAAPTGPPATASPSPSPGTPVGGSGTSSLAGGFGPFGSGASLSDPAMVQPVPPPLVAEAGAGALPVARPEVLAARPGPLAGAPSERGRGLGLAVAAVLVIGAGTAVVRVLLALAPKTVGPSA